MLEGEVMPGVSLTSTISVFLMVVSAVAGYILKRQNERHKEMSDQMEAIRNRLQEVEKLGLRHEYAQQTIDEMKDDLEKMEAKLDKQFDRVYSLVEDISRRIHNTTPTNRRG